MIAGLSIRLPAIANVFWSACELSRYDFCHEAI